MKNIIISCIPKLNETQEKGMLQLLNDIERFGYKAYIWSEYNYSSLSSHTIPIEFFNIENSLSSKLRYAYTWLNVLLKVDQSKWVTRLQRWLGNVDFTKATQVFKNSTNQAIYLFKKYEPEWFFCWNPFCCQYGIAYDIAKILNIKSAAIEWGYLPNTFIMDKKGVLAKSSIYKKNTLTSNNENIQLQLEEKGEHIFNKLQATSLSLYSQAGVSIPDEFLEPDNTHIKILVIAIDEIDAGAYPVTHSERKGLLPFHSSSMDQALAIASADKKYQVIFKPHPSHNLYIENKELERNCWLINGNPDQLIDWADVIFCSGSKMEFSALLANKPLLNFGSGLLFGKNVAYEVHKPEELDTQISLALNKEGYEDKIKAFKKFLGYIKLCYLYNFSEASSSTNQPILENILNHKN